MDWIITIVFFLVFVAWAFSFYASLFTEKAAPLGETVDTINDKILNFLTMDVYNIPIKFDSSSQTTDSVLYFNFTWPDGTKNSTRIFQDSSALPCNITGDTFYWQANLTNLTSNYFSMQFSNKTSNLSCNSAFSTQNKTQAIPWVMEKKRLFSQGNINQMTNLSYSDFKNSLEIARDFRVELNISGTETNYGKTLPLIRDIYVRETESRVEETGESITARVLVW